MIKQLENLVQNEATVESFEYSGAGFISLPNGYRQYSPIDLKNNGGVLITEGDFSQVQIWMPPTTIHYSPVATTTIPGPVPTTTPLPTFTYPNAPQWALVVAQCPEGIPVHGSTAKVNYATIPASATSEENCCTFALDGSKNLFIAFNDLVGAYYDNSGDVRVMVKLIK